MRDRARHHACPAPKAFYNRLRSTRRGPRADAGIFLWGLAIEFAETRSVRDSAAQKLLEDLGHVCEPVKLSYDADAFNESTIRLWAVALEVYRYAQSLEALEMEHAMRAAERDLPPGRRGDARLRCAADPGFRAGRGETR